MINKHIISQHAEEAAFLWLLRDDALMAPHYDLGDLKTLEDRVEGHLDGLRVAGEAAWKFCEEGLKQEEAGEVFTAGQRLLCGGPISRGCCLDVPKRGFQRQRRAAALELALLTAGVPLFNTSATARHQAKLLGLT